MVVFVLCYLNVPPRDKDKSIKDRETWANVSPSGYNNGVVKRKIESIVSVLWMKVNIEECSFKSGPSYHLWHWHDFQLFSYHPATVNVWTWKNHYSYKKVVYLPDSRWLITVEAVSMATSSLAAKGKWAFHPISFEMALVFSERWELDLLEQEFSCKTLNSANPKIFIPLKKLWFYIIYQKETWKLQCTI